VHPTETATPPGAARADDPQQSPPSSDPALDEVLRGLFRLVQQVRRTAHADPVERQAIIILSRLRENGSIRLSDLAADLMVDISTVSRQARSLEEHGLVGRTDDPDDRRAVRLHLSPAGDRVLDEAWARRHAWLERSLAGWSPEDRAVLAATLTRCADALSAPPMPAALDRSQRRTTA
jgi:DNA-binding MarR family transcriptional regulator